MNKPEAGFLAAHVPTTNNELTAKRAEDSMSMVATVLYNPLIPVGDPVAAQTFLIYRTSRTTIMRVRMTLSESETEMYTGNNWELVITNFCVQSHRIPVAILSTLALSVASVRGELKCAPVEPRYMRKGRAITQRFME